MKMHAERTGTEIVCSFYKLELPDAGQLLTSLMDAVVMATGISYNEMFTRTRKRRIAVARQLFMFVGWRNMQCFSLNELGGLFGLDHSTVIYGCRNIENLLQMRDNESRKLQEQYLEILGVRHEA